MNFKAAAAAKSWLNQPQAGGKMAWIELCMHATHEGLDWICSILAQQAVQPQIQISQAESSETGSDWMFQVQIYLEQPVDHSQLDQLQASLMPLCRTGLISPLETYLTDEKPATQPLSQQIGRFVLAPTQPPASPLTSPLISPLTPEQIPLYLTPSPAFGHGSHPATRLALQLIERHVIAGMQALDLGTGTGILGLAMAKLGATVLALDNEPAAVQAAEATVRLNQLESQMTVKLGSLGQGSELGHWMGGELEDTPAVAPAAQFDLIVANILARIHMALATDYGMALRPNGILITAGFTTEFEAEIQDAFTEVGLQLIEAVRWNEWLALAHRRS
jgi:ribosomal protein L11 methyltransferase